MRISIKAILSPAGPATHGRLLSEGRLIPGGARARNARSVKSEVTVSREEAGLGLGSSAWRKQLKPECRMPRESRGRERGGLRHAGQENRAPSSLSSATLPEPWPGSALIFIFIHLRDETMVSCCFNLISLIMSKARLFQRGR